jgi:hypothetical protein
MLPLPRKSPWRMQSHKSVIPYCQKQRWTLRTFLWELPQAGDKRRLLIHSHCLLTPICETPTDGFRLLSVDILLHVKTRWAHVSVEFDIPVKLQQANVVVMSRGVVFWVSEYFGYRELLSSCIIICCPKVQITETNPLRQTPTETHEREHLVVLVETLMR